MQGDARPAELPTSARGRARLPGLAVSCARSDALAPGAGYPPITLTVEVAAGAGPTVTNVVTVSGGGDTSTGNNTATDPTTITSCRISR